LVSKEQKKIARVVNFMKKGLTSLSDDLEETVKGINDFIKSLSKALKDLKDVSIEEEIQTVSTSSKKIVAPTDNTAKTAAASTLFNLLSGGGPTQPTSAVSPMISAPAVPAASSAPSMGAPPKKPGVVGPPKAPSSGGPPKAPPSGVGSRPNLPPAPKLPPTSSGAPPAAPNVGVTQPPTFVKRPGPPAAPTGGAPPRPSGAPTASATSSGPVASIAAAPKPGGGLSSLRDEMLEELNRLKKIMRGE
jgi:hypothetical protein